ncbi:helix-turn-helix domain-containing protein [Acinetobacter sp. TY1]|uniref:helix-turn-helix domain-containing protein n=1 Tax=Acinetobacter sp. TY1 TaxID=3387626 RepID=UPI003AF62324
MILYILIVIYIDAILMFVVFFYDAFCVGYNDMMVHLIDGPNSSFAIRLRDFRSRKGLTQDELAQCCGIAVRNISLYESGHSIPRVGTLEKLAECLDCDSYVLLHGNTRETHEYLSKQSKEFYKNVVKKNQYLYINEWDRLILRENIIFNQPIYVENPVSNGHSSNLNLFVPYIGPISNFIAVRLPKNLSLSTSDIYNNYEQILIVNLLRGTQEDLKDGVQVIYAAIDKQKLPSLGTVKREVGEENFFIQSVPNSFKYFEFDDKQYEILGIVEGVICRKL